MKLGIIVEGDTEKILLSSEQFRELMNSLNIDYIEEIINAEGAGNLLPHNLTAFVTALQQKGANKFLILTDLHDDSCYTITHQRIVPPSSDYILVIAKKHIETWFLADTNLLRNFFKKGNLFNEFPENEQNPFEYLSDLRVKYFQRGFGNKRLMTKILLKNGFSFTQAKNHTNCPSIKYFINKLNHLSQS
ncbi:MAG: hypothetical protein Q7S39_07845 [Ignavibacteria bacterium]|nr:hypothetical protein [Ignavibacteria bacterium]